MTTVAEEKPTDEPTAMVRSVAAQIDFGKEATNWDYAFRIAKVMAASRTVPAHYMGHPEDAVVAMQYGAEVGLRPMAALQSIAVINGKPGLYSDGFLGVIMASRAYVKHEECYVLAGGEEVDHLPQAAYLADETKAVAKFWRRGVEKPFVAAFSIGDAKKAKLWNKAGPWQEYPARQLLWRARGFAGRNGFAPELKGIVLADELVDIDADVIDVEPTQYDASVASGRTVVPMRRSEKLRMTIAPDEPPADPPVEPPALVTEPPDAEERSRTAKPKIPAPARDTVFDRIRITHTEWMTPPQGVDPYYKIEGKVVDKPLAYTFVTRDKDHYDFVASCEGEDAELRITVAEGYLKPPGDKKPTEKPVKFITNAEPMP